MDFLDVPIQLFSVVIAVVAIGFAKWQLDLTKESLAETKEEATKLVRRTELLLDREASVVKAALLGQSMSDQYEDLLRSFEGTDYHEPLRRGLASQRSAIQILDSVKVISRIERSARTHSDIGADDNIATPIDATEQTVWDRHLGKLRAQVERLSAASKVMRSELQVLEQYCRAIQGTSGGWPLPIVALISLVAVLLEYIPASLSAQVLTSGLFRLTLAIIFTIVAFVLAVSIGELMRALRRPVRSPRIDAILSVGAGIGAAAFLVTALHSVYTRYASTRMDEVREFYAIAIAALALVGIGVIALLSYYRETFDAFRARTRLSHLRRTLRTNDRRVRANIDELSRARTVESNAGERRSSGARAQRELDESR